MKNRISDSIKKSIEFTQSNIVKLLFIVAVDGVLYFLFQLPYINLFASIFSYLPHLITIVLIIIFFRPSKKSILITGMVLLVLSYPFLLANLQNISEPLGTLSYFFFSAYIVLMIKEIYK